MTGLLSRILREPLLHFLSAGLLLFLASQIRHQYVDPYRIVITPQREAQLARRYAQQFGAQPDTATAAQLMERDVEEEILFRRGLALGLEKDDEIVRRRIVQKMRFLMQDLQAPSEPRDAELGSYYQAHVQRYVTPARVTFSHVFFSVADGEQQARARAFRNLEALSAKDAQAATRNGPRAVTNSSGTQAATSLGDPFPDLYHFSAYDPEQVQRLFGRTEFSEAVFRAPVQHWAGPFRSSYGWHLIRVDSREEATHWPLSSVRDRVRTDYLLDAQQRANEATFNDVAREFTVVRPKS
jgi:peptidyl-prolyl cis-trans isomerase C